MWTVLLLRFYREDDWFTLYVDHKSLKWLLTTYDISWKHKQWRLDPQSLSSTWSITRAVTSRRRCRTETTNRPIQHGATGRPESGINDNFKDGRQRRKRTKKEAQESYEEATDAEFNQYFSELYALADRGHEMKWKSLTYATLLKQSPFTALVSQELHQFKERTKLKFKIPA